MKAYIAGKLGTESERKTLEKIAALCKKHGVDTFLPHREVGLARGIEDAPRIFEKDIINGFEGCSFVVASLEGLHVGAGTAWEIGYAYAKRMPVIALKMDESPAEAFEYLSSIIIASTKILGSFQELDQEIGKLVKNLS